MIAKRLFDLAGALLGLAFLWPLLLLAAIGIRLSSQGPILYRARRAGRYGVPFDMLKLRTMHVPSGSAGPRITVAGDPRVFPFGALLRRTKVDELPQLINILRGEMSIIGPRPEDPFFVSTAYTVRQRGTLLLRPGLSSPGSLFHDRICDEVLQSADSDDIYRRELLPVKLALDLEYVRRASVGRDLRLIGQTIWHLLRGPLVPRHLAPRTRTATVALGLALIAGATCTDDIGAPIPRWIHDSGEVILVGAGDIGVCGDERDDATAELLDAIPGTVFTTGDNAYPSGSLAQFETCYAPGWGRHRDRTRPSPGNHDYDTQGAAGYFAYFGARAGPAGLGYYSYDLGAWHVIVLNSEVAIDAASPQLEWLRGDLAGSDARCVVAYWHRPRFSSGQSHGNDATVAAAWEALHAAGADVVIAGHEHLYERFAPQSPTGAYDPDHGIRQFVVGTGGANEYALGETVPNSEVRETGTLGVLALRLLPAAYEWQFVPIEGEEFRDSGRGDCHEAPAAAAARP